jgi:hypothetical protein
MNKYSKIEFIKNNKEYICKVFFTILNFIENNDEIYLRSDQESFRMDIINYLYNIYLNE